MVERLPFGMRTAVEVTYPMSPSRRPTAATPPSGPRSNNTRNVLQTRGPR